MIKMNIIEEYKNIKQKENETEQSFEYVGLLEIDRECYVVIYTEKNQNSVTTKCATFNYCSDARKCMHDALRRLRILTY